MVTTQAAYRLAREPRGTPRARPKSAPAAPSKARPDGSRQRAPQPAGRSGWRAALAGVESVLMLAAGVAAAAVLAGAWEGSQSSERVVPGLTLAGEDIGGRERAQVEAVARAASERALDRELVLRAGSLTTTTTARALGARAAASVAGDQSTEADAIPTGGDVVERALSYGRSGRFLVDLRDRELARRGEIDLRIGLRFAEDRALAALRELAPEVDSLSLPTRLDLEARKLLPAERGTALLPYDSLSSVALALASGDDEIELAVADKPAVADPLAELTDQLSEPLDIGVVLGSFTTPYKTTAAAADRTFNLKVGAAALDGHLLLPGETFSFNAVVGERSADNGYRYAPGISGGQIIDMLGGGICQVASTVFGAAFFAGLEVVSARPHSRPSSYVDMGLDATVVWDTVDLVLRNPYDFPVVLHMSVSQGQVRGEVLGPRRPYRVVFERELVEALPYETVRRADPQLRTGSEAIAQRGMRGFVLERVRRLEHEGEAVDEQRWRLTYPATREIVRVGTNPEGQVPTPRELPPLRDPAGALRIAQ